MLTKSVLSVNEEITQDLVDSLNHYVHALDYTEKVCSCTARLDPQNNILRSFCACQCAKIAGLNSVAERMPAHMTIAEKGMMIMVVLGICHDNWAEQLWDEFLYFKSK